MQLLDGSIVELDQKSRTYFRKASVKCQLVHYEFWVLHTGRVSRNLLHIMAMKTIQLMNS